MSRSDRMQVVGSERQLEPGHVRIGEIDPQERVDISVYVGHRVPPQWVDGQARRPPQQRRRIARREWAQAHGADPDQINAVCEFAEAHNLIVKQTDEARRVVRLNGAAATVADAFGATFRGTYAPEHGHPGYRARSGPLTVPPDLRDVIRGVFGIDDRPQARPHIRFAERATTSYTPVQVAQAYAFPSGVDGTGQTVGIIELGGGYNESDLTAYFQGLGLAVPSVTAVSVDGATNNPGADRNADGEVMLDIEVIGAIAPGADIVVYFAPNTDQGFIDAVSRAVHDTTHHPSVVSISWGGSEDSWTEQARTQMEQILTDAGGLGVTVTVAAGDNGSTDGSSDGSQHVDFPASAPHALGCGGTRLEASGTQISSETVWGTTNQGATGGGVSRQFALPSYQSSAKVPTNVNTNQPGRGVPDVAGDADPDSGYRVRVDGSDETIGGTSAVAPLWAALIALLNQSLKAPLGFAQPRLYALLGSTAFHDITSGNNGAYSAGPGWDACTGLGSPSGATLARQLGGS